MQRYDKKKKKLNGKGIPSLLTYFLRTKCEINYFVRQDTLPYIDTSTTNKHYGNKLLTANFSWQFSFSLSLIAPSSDVKRFSFSWIVFLSQLAFKKYNISCFSSPSLQQFSIFVQHSDAGLKFHALPLNILHVLSYHLPFSIIFGVTPRYSIFHQTKLGT